MKPNKTFRLMSQVGQFKSLHHLLPLPNLASFHASTYLRLLESYIVNKNLHLGSQIHSRILISGLASNSFLATKLITLYSHCGNLRTAEAIFTRVPECNVFLLNGMIRGYSVNGLCRDAINVFHRKRQDGVHPDSYSFSCALKASASLSDLSQGKRLHILALGSGFGTDVFVSNSLMSMYANCSRLDNATDVFDRMPQRDIVSWNSIISAYTLNGFGFEALEKVREMVGYGLKPDRVTVVGILSPCVTTDVFVREVHGYVLRIGFESTSMIRNSLVSAYGKCDRTKEARRIFDSSTQKDRVTWNALISCYAQNGLFEESMGLLRDMKQSEFDPDVITYSGIISSLSQNDLYVEATTVFEELLSMGLKPDDVAIASILPAVSGDVCFDHCKEIHAYSYRHNLEKGTRVRNALVSVYTKCGSVRYAEQVFQSIKIRDVISWSSMIVGYQQNHYFIEALDTFRQMIRTKMVPNPITITGILSACSGISGLNLGKEIHLWAVKNSFDGQAFVGSALVDMYAKCGRIKDSRNVFDLMGDRTLVTWNSMIGGYAINGLGEEAVRVFRMVREPDQVSFITVLSACRHAGLIEEGIKILNSMKDSKVSPREGHYACMVDLLARSGRLDEALELVRTMPMEPSAETLGVVLGACKIHSDFEIGIDAGERIVKLGSGNSGYYVLLSNMLASCGRWGDVEEMRELMKERGVKKGVGCSWIEVNKGVYPFVARERIQNSESDSLARVLGVLNVQMRGMSW